MLGIAKRKKKYLITLITLLQFCSWQANAQHSIARAWNEVLLEAIRDDYARPTVHARNLFHTSAAIYDAWAIYNTQASTYLLGNQLHQTKCPVNNFSIPDNIDLATHETISYAAYRILTHRFKNSPNWFDTQNRFNELMVLHGYDIQYESLNYFDGNAAALGNFIAQCYIEYGLTDGSNELNQYANTFYIPVNEPLNPEYPGNLELTNPNRYQTLQLGVFIDQSGNEIIGAEPEALSPEWGFVKGFALTDSELTTKNRDGHNYNVYHDPGPPAYLNDISNTDEIYKWGFEMVCIWSAHLTNDDDVLLDISPAAIGNNNILPDTYEEYDTYYNYFEGGDLSNGHSINPITNLPYAPNIVNRGNYARVLAEFWADGPDSETPPGHWFTLLNYINDHPLFEKKFEGEGDIIDDLEWDVKSYFLMGGTMHDSAISAWSVKGYYDYIRPVSAIRYLADQGQCTNESLARYNENGIHLVPGYIELVDENDPLAGSELEHLNKIKIYAWNGPDSIANPLSDFAGVGWILAENWWPYQRPTFVTPPFAGFVSGHSTFSRAAADVLTKLTGSNFFPGGMGQFEIEANNFLVFERGPSESFSLQWATYQDAADQSALSRIWGGIHPPIDDIPGRKIGIKVAESSFDLAVRYFNGEAINPIQNSNENEELVLFPNPADSYTNLVLPENAIGEEISISIYSIEGRLLNESQSINVTNLYALNTDFLLKGFYLVKLKTDTNEFATKLTIIR